MTVIPPVPRGYIHGLFRIFRLTDIPEQAIPLHFHDFRKIVILLAGSHAYDIEGIRYPLEAGDLVLVDAGELHRPVLSEDPDQPYHRIILYLSDEFFQRYADARLDRCFQRLKDGLPHVIHGTVLPPQFSQQLIPALKEVSNWEQWEQQLLDQCHLVQLLLELNHLPEHREQPRKDTWVRNPEISKLLLFLNDNLTGPLDILRAAEYVHMDPSYLMHLFKAETGSTIMSYVTEKRLFLAQSLLRQGMSPSEACENSGFTNYTSFYRAYRSRYGASPRTGVHRAAPVVKE